MHAVVYKMGRGSLYSYLKWGTYALKQLDNPMELAAKRCRTPFKGSLPDFLGTELRSVESGLRDGKMMKPYPSVDHLWRLILWVAMPRAAGNARRMRLQTLPLRPGSRYNPHSFHQRFSSTRSTRRTHPRMAGLSCGGSAG
jgi:hypothetical protein